MLILVWRLFGLMLMFARYPLRRTAVPVSSVPHAAPSHHVRKNPYPQPPTHLYVVNYR